MCFLLEFGGRKMRRFNNSEFQKRIWSIEQNVSIIDLMWLIRKKIKGKKFTGND